MNQSFLVIFPKTYTPSIIILWEPTPLLSGVGVLSFYELMWSNASVIASRSPFFLFRNSLRSETEV